MAGSKFTARTRDLTVTGVTRADTVDGVAVGDGDGDAWRNGDAAEARFEQLYDRHYGDVLQYALRRIVEPDRAADAVAETFLVAWRRLDDVPPGAEARPWLFGVARRAMANQRRGDRRRSALVERLGAELGTVPVRRPASVDLSLSDVGAVFRGLPDNDREVLTLVAWEALGTRDLAVALGCSHTAARLRLHRARRRLARSLRATGIELEPLIGAAPTTAADPPVAVSSPTPNPVRKGLR